MFYNLCCPSILSKTYAHTQELEAQKNRRAQQVEGSEQLSVPTLTGGAGLQYQLAAYPFLLRSLSTCQHQ